MKRRNPYAGILKPRTGDGPPEVSVVVLYDVEDDRVRSRMAEVCLDYGLERIQFSAFLGKLNRNRRQELALRLQGEAGDTPVRVRVIPICAEDLDQMWVWDRYGKQEKSGPGIRVVRESEAC